MLLHVKVRNVMLDQRDRWESKGRSEGRYRFTTGARFRWSGSRIGRRKWLAHAPGRQPIKWGWGRGSRTSSAARISIQSGANHPYACRGGRCPSGGTAPSFAFASPCPTPPTRKQRRKRRRECRRDEIRDTRYEIRDTSPPPMSAVSRITRRSRVLILG